MRLWGIGAVGASALLLSSCSLAGLTSYETAHCDAMHHCEGLNARDQLLESACVRWNCEVGTAVCVLGPRDLDGDGDPDPACSSHGADCDEHDERRSSLGRETCDGLDNDCDLAVDEDVVAPIAEDALVAPTEPSIAAAAVHGRQLVLVSGVTASSVHVDAASPTLTTIDHEMPGAGPDDLVSNTGWMARTMGCPAPVTAMPGTFASVACNDADVALDAIGDGSALLATISTDVCDRGLLRLGILSDASDRHQGPSSLSSVWLGIEPSGNCTGAEGAARPSVSLVDDTHALVAYLRTSVSGLPSCRDDVDADVVALPIEIRTNTAVGRYVTTSSSAAAVVLGRSGTLAPPAMADWPGVGWLVAFPDTTTGLALRLVRTDASGALVVTMLPTLEDVGPLDSVSFAGGAASTGARDFGLVMGRSRDPAGGCPLRRPYAWVGLRVDPTAATATTFGSLAVADGSAAAITYTPEGLSVGAASHGGWLAMVITANGVVARRVSETGMLVDRDPIPIADGTRFPMLLAHDDDAATFAFMRGTTLVRGELLCTSAPR